MGNYFQNKPRRVLTKRRRFFLLATTTACGGLFFGGGTYFHPSHFNIDIKITLASCVKLDERLQLLLGQGPQV